MFAVFAIAAIVVVHPESAPPVAAQGPASFTSLNDLGTVLRPADRVRAPIVVPSTPIPARLTRETQQTTVSFNGCTGSLVRDDHGSIVGLAGAGHCVRSSSNVMRDGHIFGTGNIVAFDRADIELDSAADLFYVGLNGRNSADVRAQLVHNLERVGITTRQASAAALMTGYPRYNNQRNEPVTLALTVGGIVHWPRDPVGTIATFGNWNSRNQSCSPRASGSGLYLNLDGHGYVIVGVLSSRAEFERVQTMPYGAAYGLELRQFFEQQLSRTIDAEFLCGFAQPTPA